MDIQNSFFSGYHREGHVQGIAVDAERGHVYYSFTTMLLKTDFDGNPIATVENLAGHLGCITLDAEKRRVYGSLELKHDSIGKAITQRTGYGLSDEDAFYAVSFDIDRMDRMHMNAETDGVMSAVWLSDVVADYSGCEPDGTAHRYGCSGIDGIALGPVFGKPADSEKKLMIAYGIYGDVDRSDNDHQVILRYGTDVFDRYGKALLQSEPHHSGPTACEKKYFVHTGNTRWGIQNLEYDPFSEDWLVAVYVGSKPEFTNFNMFFIDGTIAPNTQELHGRGGERGEVLTLAKLGEKGMSGIYGCFFPYGETGMCSMGDGTFYFSVPEKDKEKKAFCCTLKRARMEKDKKEVFVWCDGSQR